MSDDWLEVMAIAHRHNLATTATMMFGHVETVEGTHRTPRPVRMQQDATGGFTAFIPGPFRLRTPSSKPRPSARTNTSACRPLTDLSG